MIMKKTNKIINTIYIYVVILVTIGIFGTYLEEYLEDSKFFNDRTTEQHACESLEIDHEHYAYGIGYTSFWNGKNCTYEFYKRIDWGERHYWYFWGVTILWIITAIRGVFIISFLLEEKDDN